jgi:EAL domain-containing protein (putative c-di-GMP-specific phosphodiesterase class I)
VDPDFFLHINITAEDLMCPDYSARVMSLLGKYSLPSRNLVLEITESSLMKSISVCRKNLVNLRKMGVRISLDDFGSGYSSLNYLRELPVDEVKIDRAFIEDVRKDCYNHSFISAIVLLAHSISTEVCIEGVESREQANTVATLNADTYQGFYYGRPVSAVDFDNLYFQQSASIV